MSTNIDMNLNSSIYIIGTVTHFCLTSKLSVFAQNRNNDSMVESLNLWHKFFGKNVVLRNQKITSNCSFLDKTVFF